MKHGVCNICGVVGPLSFEHTPPQSAFNSSKVLYATADKYWNHGPGNDKRASGYQFQGGYGKHSICERCNNFTGKWYVPYFADWCKRGMEYYDVSKGLSSTYNTSFLFPLPVIKEILTMFLARNGEHFEFSKKESLVRFILNRDQRYLDPKYRVWVYQVAPGPLRDAPLGVAMNIVKGEGTHGAEFSFPPYGYLVTLNSRPADVRLCEITWFSRYDFLAMTQLSLNLPVLPTHGPALGDYRSFKDMSPKSGNPHVVLKHPGL